MNELVHHQRYTHHIDPKTSSIQANTRQWKDNLRKSCLSRAKAARRELLLRKRRVGQDSALTSDGGHTDIIHEYEVHITKTTCEVKREIIDAYNEEHPDENSMHCIAKSLIDQELQRSIPYLNEIGLQSRQHGELHDEFDDNGNARMISWSEDTLETNEMIIQEDEKGNHAISEIDYVQLLNDVANELQREGA